MNKTALTAPEVAQLLGIAPNTVYAMVKRGELNCYMVGRKMRFTYDEVQRYIHKDSPAAAPTQPTPQAVPAPTQISADPNQFVICGKDEILDVLATSLRRELPSQSVVRTGKDSYNSLIDLYTGRTTVAACHMWDVRTNTYNLPYIRAFLPGCNAVMIHCAMRTQGFYVAAGNPKNIRGWEDLAREDVVLINREAGAGTRILLDQQLQRLGIARSAIRGYNNCATSHLSVAVSVSKGESDAGIGTEKNARSMNGLDFIPLQQESYDLVFKAEDKYLPAIQKMLQILQSESFQEQFRFMAGYDVSQMGKVTDL